MKNKKLKLSILSLALVAVVGIGGTLAYLSQRTDEKVNTFTMGAGLSGELREPAWDNGSFKGEESEIDTDKLGETLAKHFTPGLEIPKNPAVKNTSSEGDAWVAIKIDYVNVEGSGDGRIETPTTYAALDKFTNIEFGSNWILNDDKTIAYYNLKLNADDKTQDLFSKVVIDTLAITQNQLDNKQYTESLYTTEKPASDYVMSNFDIKLQGYLVQTQGFNSAQEAMVAAFPNEFK